MKERQCKYNTKQYDTLSVYTIHINCVQYKKNTTKN